MILYRERPVQYRAALNRLSRVTNVKPEIRGVASARVMQF